MHWRSRPQLIGGLPSHLAAARCAVGAGSANPQPCAPLAAASGSPPAAPWRRSFTCPCRIADGAELLFSAATGALLPAPARQPAATHLELEAGPPPQTNRFNPSLQGQGLIQRSERVALFVVKPLVGLKLIPARTGLTIEPVASINVVGKGVARGHGVAGDAAIRP